MPPSIERYSQAAGQQLPFNAQLQGPMMPGAPQQQQPQMQAPGGFDMAALLAALRPQQQPQMDLGAIIRELHAPRQQSHLGIGGAPITNDNPQGNVGGDPFTNGFFQHLQQQPMNVLGGSPLPSPDQMSLLHQSQMAQQPQPWQIPPGDPGARAFWSALKGSQQRAF